ncbi:hypothetical protein F4803DRAFT_578143 [Xylaria telfairii]|nr:hypothetical protein F4803DRAFT_578143 [Xylaria telfairii]
MSISRLSPDRSEESKKWELSYNCIEDENERICVIGSGSSGGSPMESKLRLACPFYTAYPSRFQMIKACTSPGFRDISRVKEHIRRCHLKPNYQCRRCHEVFDNEADLDNHTNKPEVCTLIPSNSISIGINQDTMCKINSRKRTRGPSEKEKWNQIWEILFPDYQPPESPYTSPTSTSQTFLSGLQHYLECQLTDDITNGLLNEGLQMDRGAIRSLVTRCVSERVQLFRQRFDPNNDESKSQSLSSTVDRCEPLPLPAKSTAESATSTTSKQTQSSCFLQAQGVNYGSLNTQCNSTITNGPVSPIYSPIPTFGIFDDISSTSCPVYFA